MNEPLITIGIPSYNHSKYIQYCLDSVRDEGYTNKEVVIIDDGSTDNSVELIEIWKANNPQINLTLITRENKGLNSTLNELVSKANGEFYCLLASDDALLFNSLQVRLDVLLKHPNKYIVIGDAMVMDSENNIIMESAITNLYKGNKDNYKTDDLLLYSVVKEWSIPGPVAMMRKSIFDVIGKYPEDQFAEDIFFYMKTIGLRMLSFVDFPVAMYRVHPNNTGGNKKYSKELSMTFIKAYIATIQYFPIKLQLIILKKIAGRIYLYLKAHI